MFVANVLSLSEALSGWHSGTWQESHMTLAHTSATIQPVMQVFKIVPTVQQYDWGKLGTSSKVAVFAQSAGISDFYVDESKPYAEVRFHVMNPCIEREVNAGEAVDGHTSEISLPNASLGRNSCQLSFQEPKSDWRKGLAKIWHGRGQSSLSFQSVGH
jgi:hypothetical protein